MGRPRRERGDATSTTVGARIAQCRKERGLTLDALGIKLGITAVAVSRWELGDNMPSLVNFIQLSDMFGYSIDWFLGRREF